MKGFLERLAEMDHAAYVDVSRDVPVSPGSPRRAFDSVEDRSNAHVMRSNGRTTDEIVRRFGYEPRPLAPSGTREPSRAASVRPGAKTSDTRLQARDKRNLMEPG